MTLDFSITQSAIMIMAMRFRYLFNRWRIFTFSGINIYLCPDINLLSPTLLKAGMSQQSMRILQLNIHSKQIKYFNILKNVYNLHNIVHRKRF